MTLPRDLGGLSLAFLEGLYEQFERDPASVEPEWRSYFEQLGHRNGEPLPATLPAKVATAAVREFSMAVRQDRVDQLIRAYRVRGHMIARIDPLGFPRPMQAELDPEYYGFSAADMDHPFSTRTMGGADVRTLGGILKRLWNTYCRYIGVQFMHIDELSVRDWLQSRMEETENRVELSRAEQVRILTRLTDAVIFEEFIQKKFTGAKSFSLEGAESLIPLLDLAIEKAGELRIDEVVLGMAHRGRLNVLANIMGKSPRQIFREFADIADDAPTGGGDVKYHLGYSTDWNTASGHKVHLSLCFNPSHLEFVNPVAQGRLRAKQDRMGDLQRRRGLAILIHGDAAFAGEGVVQETFNLSGLSSYAIGGTIHIVVNNQIGFTTPPAQGRSCAYATDVAKMLQSPIFHVNGEDPDAVAAVVRLALDFRREFQRDVVIDMYCYRRRGHNEGDEPSFTQPLLYDAIERRKTVRESYLEHLLKADGLTREEADRIATERRNHLEEELSVARSEDYVARAEVLTRVWSPYRGGSESRAGSVVTGVDKARLGGMLRSLTQLPADFHAHPKITRLLDARREMADGKRPLDWSAAEALAFGTLSTEGYRIRLTGQDCERGTFSHRHSVLHDVQDGHMYMPLAKLAPDQAPVEIYNSPLSETGVLGFEFGYSLDYPEALVLWEAQFGDFANAGQVIIDQFIASCEDKWRRLSGLVLLLPHAFEGMGPEHSSARLERFLVLAAEDNLQVANCTTPSQYFHILRRQVLRHWRKPLVIMTPKSLLRHPEAVSSLADLAEGEFQRVIPDSPGRNPAQVRRVLICSGKLYYELELHRREQARDDVAIIRLEQLYPLPAEPLSRALSVYAAGTPVTWVQEEPINMGAWSFLRVQLGERLWDRHPFAGVARAESASPATGSAAVHRSEQKELIARAFGEAAVPALEEAVP